MEEDAVTRRMKKRITDEKEHGEFEGACGYIEFDNLAEYLCIGNLVASGFTNYDPNCSSWTIKNGHLSAGVVWVC